MKDIIAIIIVAVTLGAGAAYAASGARPDDDEFSLVSVFDYSPGKFGAANSIDLLNSAAATAEYENGQWMFQVAVPFARIPTAGGLSPGVGHIIGTNGTGGETLSGLGDTVAAASYNIYSGAASTFGIDLTGKVKLRAADAGFGIGQNDYAAQADAYQSFNRFTALGSLGYKVLGNPSGISMNRVIYGSFGGAYQLDDKMQGGVDLNLTQSPSFAGDGHRELTAYVSRRIGKNFKAKGYVLKGFSNGSPDSSLGAQVHYGF